MKVLSVLVLMLGLALSMTIKSKLKHEEENHLVADYYMVQSPAGECLDPDGECTKPCHLAYQHHQGKCPYGDKYNPENYDEDYDFAAYPKHTYKPAEDVYVPPDDVFDEIVFDTTYVEPDYPDWVEPEYGNYEALYEDNYELPFTEED